MTDVSIRAKLLHEAVALVTGDRNETHGDPYEQLGQTAALWTAYLGVPITREQVAVCNILQKISRSCHGRFNIDDIRDTIGYAGIWGEMALSPDGAAHLQKWADAVSGR